MDIGTLLLGCLIGALVVRFIYGWRLYHVRKKVTVLEHDLTWTKNELLEIKSDYKKASQNTFTNKLFELQNLVKLRTYRETLKSIDGVKSCLVMYIFDNFIEYHWSNAIPNLDLKRGTYSLNTKQLQELTAVEVSLAQAYRINLQNTVDCKPNQEKEG